MHWLSAKAGGALGTSAWIEGTADLDVLMAGGPGYYAITATAYDAVGQSAWDTVVAKVDQSAPQVWIDSPADGAVMVPQTPYQLAGSSFDPDTFSALPCANLTWTSSRRSDSDFPVTGCFPVVSFSSLGTRQITLTGVDGTNRSGQTSITVEVAEPNGSAPLVLTFLAPGPGTLTPAGAATTVTATATRYGSTTPILLSFELVYGNTSTFLLSGTIAPGQPLSVTFQPDAYLPPNCGSSSYQIRAAAASDGGGVTKALPLEALFPPC